MASIVFGGEAVVRGPSGMDDLQINVVETPLFIGSSSSTITIRDVVRQYNSGGTIDNNCLIQISDSAALPGYSLSLDPSSVNVCQLSDGGELTRLADGDCVVNISALSGNRKFVRNMRRNIVGSLVSGAPVSYVPGSLRAYLRAQLESALSGVTPGGDEQRARTLGQTAVNPINFLRAQNKLGFDPLPLDLLDELLAPPGWSWRAWVSPRHFITWVGHGAASTSDRVAGYDFAVYWSHTPWAGNLVRFLPAGWESKLPPIDSAQHGHFVHTGIPCWVSARNTYTAGETRWVMPAGLIDGALPASDPLKPYQRSTTQNGSEIIMTGGDSGSPVFCGVNSQVVMLSHVFYGSRIGYYHYAWLVDYINSAMNQLASSKGDPAAGTYQCLFADISMFPNF